MEKPLENLDGKITGARKKTKENSLTEGGGTKLKKGADKVDQKLKVVPSETTCLPVVDVTSKVADTPCVPKSYRGFKLLKVAPSEGSENSNTMRGVGTKMKMATGRVDKKLKVVPTEGSENAVQPIQKRPAQLQQQKPIMSPVENAEAIQMNKTTCSPVVDIASRVTDTPCVPKSKRGFEQDWEQLGNDIVSRWGITLVTLWIFIYQYHLIRANFKFRCKYLRQFRERHFKVVFKDGIDGIRCLLLVRYLS